MFCSMCSHHFRCDPTLSITARRMGGRSPLEKQQKKKTVSIMHQSCLQTTPERRGSGDIQLIPWASVTITVRISCVYTKLYRACMASSLVYNIISIEIM